MKQIFWDLFTTSSFFSPTFLSKRRSDRRRDRSSIKINRSIMPPNKRVKFSPHIMGQRSRPVDFSIFSHYSRFLSSLPSSSIDRVKVLIQFISRELTVSSGMGFLEKKTLGKRFQTGDNPFLSVTGKPGFSITSNQGPPGSLSELTVIESGDKSRILPFETRQITDRRGRTHLPGSIALVDQIVRFGDGCIHIICRCIQPDSK